MSVVGYLKRQGSNTSMLLSFLLTIFSQKKAFHIHMYHEQFLFLCTCEFIIRCVSISTTELFPHILTPYVSVWQTCSMVQHRQTILVNC